jgi:hypothetical protein
MLLAGPASAGAQTPTQAGQDAYAAIAEVVRILEADAGTDWSKVNLEALRQHLVDMNQVTLRAVSRATNVPGGARFEVTGQGTTAESIRRMLGAHAPMLDQMTEYRATSENIPGGVRLTVLAEGTGDTATESWIRGLGFIGLLTVGAHHAVHHLALARGESMAHHY